MLVGSRCHSYSFSKLIPGSLFESELQVSLRPMATLGQEPGQAVQPLQRNNYVASIQMKVMDKSISSEILAILSFFSPCQHGQC